MLVRVNDPDRLVNLLMFLRNSGFPLVQRQDEATVKLHTDDETRLRAGNRDLGRNVGRACRDRRLDSFPVKRVCKPTFPRRKRF
jgi:hypothetical protein